MVASRYLFVAPCRPWTVAKAGDVTGDVLALDKGDATVFSARR
jgi:hypothetical protein